MADSRRRTGSAARNRSAGRRYTTSDRNGYYIDGNTVRKVQEYPDQYPYDNTARRSRTAAAYEPAPKPRGLSAAAKRNRERTAGIGKGFIIFLSIISAAILVICVQYLKLQTQITSAKSEVASLEAQLTQLREDNDEYYSQVSSDINFDNIRNTAIGKLGMKYPKDEQILTYETEGKSYVRQYQDVPDLK
jgi:cell division protein FtsL